VEERREILAGIPTARDVETAAKRLWPGEQARR
jgi:hypothetical protein